MSTTETDTARWISRFVCCDFMDSWAAWDTWEEADQQRRWWEETEAEGHKRVGLVYEAAEPQRQGHHDGHEPLPAHSGRTSDTTEGD